MNDTSNNNNQNHFISGELNFNSGNYFEAITNYSDAIKINPYQDILYYKRAMTMAILWKEFRSYWQNESSLSDERKKYFNKNIGNGYLPDNTNEIINDYLKAIELNPTQSKYYNNLGVATNSIEYITKAIEIEPTISEYYYHRAYLKKISDKQGAINDIKTAIKIKSRELAESYYNLGALLEVIPEDYNGAKIYFDKAFDLDSTLFGNQHPDELAVYERPSMNSPKYL